MTIALRIAAAFVGFNVVAALIGSILAAFEDTNKNAKETFFGVIILVNGIMAFVAIVTIIMILFGYAFAGDPFYVFKED